MLKRIKVLMIGLLMAGWVGLFLHQHPEHHQDLHAGHSVCQICSVAQNHVRQAALHPQELLPVPAQQYFSAKKQNSVFATQVNLFSYSSRAPPTA